MQNREIAKIFSELADLLEIKGENHFKVRAYRNAVRMIEGLGEPLEEMVKRGEDLTKLPGIGTELSKKIREIVTTGKLSKLEKVRKELPDSLRALLSIEGLGPKRVKALYEQLHITDPNTLKQAAAEHKISALSGFGEKTEEKILKGLRLLKQEGVRHLFAEAEPIAKDLKRFLEKAPTLQSVEIAGSFRRRKETVGDLDILCTAKNPAKVIDYFTTYEKIAQVISAGDTRSTVVLKNALQIDLRVVESKSYGAALHYFTGSKSHVIAIREIAIERGLKINEYGVFKGKTAIASKSEEEVYASVGLQYIEPELRENRGEIEAAQKGTLPRLIEQKDIHGDLHMHTTYSDGMESIEAMAQKAQSIGYEYIAITDHSATLAVVQGMDVAKAKAQLTQIDALNAKFYPFRILKGIEVDILEDGSLGMDDAILKELDIVNAAIHSKFKLSQKEQTKRLLKAIEHPFVTGIAHPTGRLIGKREAMQLDMDTIFKACKRANVYLEINSQPERLDLNDILIKKAKEAGVKFSIATDAHAAVQLEYMRYGIHQARRGWLAKEDVINTLPLHKLLQAVRKGR
jgi:DNA polymerase (family 10)